MSSILRRCLIKKKSLLQSPLLSNSLAHPLLPPLQGYSKKFQWNYADNNDEDSAIPWVRQVVNGSDLLRNSKYSKGLAFTEEERDRLHLRGLLPAASLSLELQVERVMLNIRSKESMLDKYFYLLSLYERNQRLFFNIIYNNFEELLPVIHNPTARVACRGDNLMFRSFPEGLYISLKDKGKISRILKNWPERRIKLIVVTDGSKVGPLLYKDDDCDLGVQSISIPISKLFMYTVCGGIHPEVCIPVTIDAGTNNEELLASPFYVGLKHKRVTGDAYFELLDEFLTAVKKIYDNTVVIQCVDMKYETTSKLINMYHSELPCIHDGGNNRAATILAGILGALPLTGIPLEKHVMMFVGEGEIVSRAAEMMAFAISNKFGQTLIDGRENIWLVDKKGLVVYERGDSQSLEEYKIPFLRKHHSPCPDLESAVESIKPTILIGCSFTKPSPYKFTRKICESLVGNVPRPIIFPLSPCEPECEISDCMEWTQGKALVSTIEGNNSKVILPNGEFFIPRQCHTTYIFPGVILGLLISRSNKLKFDQYIAAAHAVANLVTNEDRMKGWVFPDLSDPRKISAYVATAVAMKSYEAGTATKLPKPSSLLKFAEAFMYEPKYKNYL